MKLCGNENNKPNDGWIASFLLSSLQWYCKK